MAAVEDECLLEEIQIAVHGRDAEADPAPEFRQRDVLADLKRQRLEQPQEFSGLADTVQRQDVPKEIGRNQLPQIRLPFLRRLREHHFGIGAMDQAHLQTGRGFVRGLHPAKLQLAERQQEQGTFPARERLAGALCEIE